MDTNHRSLSELAEATGVPEKRLAVVLIDPTKAHDEDRIAIHRACGSNPESLSLDVALPVEVN